MKKLLIFLSVLFVSAGIASAQQSIFDKPCVSEYAITESVSLGSAITTSGGQVTGTVSGKVGGKVIVNTKANFLKMGGHTISFSPEKMSRKDVLNSVLYCGTGISDGNQVKFQVIEDFANNTVNVIAEWPDHSASRVIGKLSKRK